MTINCSKCSQPLNAVECAACAQPAEILAPLLAVDPAEHALLLAVAERATEWHNVASGKLSVPVGRRWMVMDDFASAVEALVAWREAK